MPTKYQYSIAVCDDTAADLEQIVNMTRAYFDARKISCSIDRFTCAAQVLEAIREGSRFHLLVLDVMMEQMGGIELAAELRQQKENAAIVLVSSNREMAIRGYEVAAARYLTKPIEPEKLYEALHFCYQSHQESREILFPTAKGTRRIAPSEILYAEAADRGTRLILSQEQVETAMRMFELEALLSGPQFVLCHRAFLVNLSFARCIRCYELELKNGQVVPVSKHRYAATKQKLIEYLKL